MAAAALLPLASLPFPGEAPYRINQVMAAPAAMALGFLALLLTAAGLSWAAWAGGGRSRLWWPLAGLQLLLVASFFTLASWGTSDVTKLSHFLAFDLSMVRGEPFWTTLAPLLVRLPYRMALVHGLVAAGYAAAGLLLARAWAAAAWGGWWALLFCGSPLLRNFLQNGVSRQALATLLLLPTLLWAGRLLAPGPRLRPAAVAGAAGALLVHSSSPASLPLALLPRLLASSPQGNAGGGVPQAGRWQAAWRWRPGRRALLLVLAALALAVAAALLLAGAGSVVVAKLQAYISRESYYHRYPLAVAVGRLQLAMAVGVVLTLWRRRLGWRTLLACGHSRQLAVFALLYLLLQRALAQGWQGPLLSRFTDPVGFFLLVLWLAWLARHRCLWAALPALVVTLDHWLLELLPGSLTLRCGSNDAFLCIPDRWPWRIDYGPLP
jgi:hypothetical protein